MQGKANARSVVPTLRMFVVFAQRKVAQTQESSSGYASIAAAEEAASGTTAYSITQTSVNTT